MATKKSEDVTCRRDALKLIERIGYEIYLLQTIGRDGCVTKLMLPELNELEERVTAIRRRIKYGEEGARLFAGKQ